MGRSRGSFFITICCAKREANQLATGAVFLVMTDALEHYIRQEKLWTRLVLAMPDHLHALLPVPAAERLDKVVRAWKRYVAKAAGVAWQDGFFDHRVRNSESLEEKAHDIRMNPVRAGLVQNPDKWPDVWPVVANPAARPG